MRLLIGAASVAIIAATGYYFTGEYTAYAAHIEQRRAAIAEASLADCKSAIFDASLQNGYQGSDSKLATPLTQRADKCILTYPQLADYAQGSALDMVQRAARLKQLSASN